MNYSPKGRGFTRQWIKKRPPIWGPFLIDQKSTEFSQINGRGLRTTAPNNRLTLRSRTSMNPTDILKDISQINKLVSLTAQFISHHTGLGLHRANHRDTDTLALDGFNQPPKITITRKQNYMVKVIGHFHHVDGQLDVHITLDLTTPTGIGEFLHRLRNHRVTVVIQPIDQRSNRRILLIFNQSGVVKRANQSPLRAVIVQNTLVVKIRAKRTRRSIKVRTVNEQRNLVGIINPTHLFLHGMRWWGHPLNITDTIPFAHTPVKGL